MITALLPMKGTSERVPNKNIKNFNGMPLFYAILEQLLISKYITKVVINTDSDIIADLAIKYSSKVKVLKRPISLIGNDIPMNKIIQHDIDILDSNYFIQTHSTSPLLSIKTIDNAIEFFLNNLDIYDSVFSVTKLQTRFYNKQFKAINHNPAELIKTQDLEPLFEENSGFYIFSKKSFLASNQNRIGVNPYMYEISKIESIDIDTQEDFELAELVYRSLRRLK